MLIVRNMKRLFSIVLTPFLIAVSIPSNAQSSSDAELRRITRECEFAKKGLQRRIDGLNRELAIYKQFVDGIGLTDTFSKFTVQHKTANMNIPSNQELKERAAISSHQSSNQARVKSAAAMRHEAQVASSTLRRILGSISCTERTLSEVNNTHQDKKTHIKK